MEYITRGSVCIALYMGYITRGSVCIGRGYNLSPIYGV